MTRALDEQAGVLVLRAWVETGQGLGNVTIFTNAGTSLPEESGSRPGPRGRVAAVPTWSSNKMRTNRDVAGALTGAQPEPGCWPTKAYGCWRRQERSRDRGRGCPAG